MISEEGTLGLQRARCSEELLCWWRREFVGDGVLADGVDFVGIRDFEDAVVFGCCI
jgi:hypothetical protein